MKAIILAGGNGERFWPLSTAKKPKQFLNVFGGESLIRQSVSRLSGLVRPEDIYVITTAELVKLTRRELPELPLSNIVGEPMRRDTGAAVALGVTVATSSTAGIGRTHCPATDEMLCFFSSDQLITDVRAFRRAVRSAVKQAKARAVIVTLGIRPHYPATGFGYVDPETGRFVEKPDLQRAKRYIKRGFLWNAGMFIGRASVFRGAFAAHAPQLLKIAPTKRAYEPLPRISFDYAVMEKLSRESKVAVVPCDCGWDDVGTYSAFDKHYPHDENGNVRVGTTKLVDADGNVCISQKTPVSLLGVRNLVVVVTAEGVLVADKLRLAEMKKLFQ